MTDAELLVKVKKGLGITGDFKTKLYKSMLTM